MVWPPTGPWTTNTVYVCLSSCPCLSPSCFPRALGSWHSPSLLPWERSFIHREVYGGGENCILSLNLKRKSNFMNNSFSCALPFGPFLSFHSFSHKNISILRALGLWYNTVFTQEMPVMSTDTWDLVSGLSQRNILPWGKSNNKTVLVSSPVRQLRWEADLDILRSSAVLNGDFLGRII